MLGFELAAFKTEEEILIISDWLSSKGLTLVYNSFKNSKAPKLRDKWLIAIFFYLMNSILASWLFQIITVKNS